MKKKHEIMIYKCAEVAGAEARPETWGKAQAEAGVEEWGGWR
ncbi:hypothetical protein [Azospirillum sp. TSH100]|nr:hypothetical protein [Azospirillum sp. TSH100]